jgi:hypothetical protein
VLLLLLEPAAAAPNFELDEEAAPEAAVAAAATATPNAVASLTRASESDSAGGYTATLTKRVATGADRHTLADATAGSRPGRATRIAVMPAGDILAIELPVSMATRAGRTVVPVAPTPLSAPAGSCMSSTKSRVTACRIESHGSSRVKLHISGPLNM